LARNDYIVGLDVGTSKVTALIGEVDAHDKVHIIGVGTAPSRGLRKGVVVDIDGTVKAIAEATEQASRMAGFRVKSVWVGVGGCHISFTNSRGVVAVSREDKEIGPEDVQRAVDAARVINLPPDREIVHVLPREFIVDGYDGVKDPVGMLGMRLEVETHIVTGAITSIQNLLRSVYKAGLEVEDVILLPLAAGRAVLMPDEMELGVAVVDIGAGTTDVAVFQGGSLMFTAVLPVGGNHITSDVGVGLRTPLSQAERIKIEHGAASADGAAEEPSLDIPTVGGQGHRAVSPKELALIIEPRAQEILAMTVDRIVRSGVAGNIPGGVVLTGGSANLQGLVDLAARELNVPVRLGTPQGVQGMTDVVENPAYAAGVGLIRFAAESLGGQRPMQEGGIMDSVIERFRRWFADFF